jgi:tetratricopeptide (TPR) repeat protein
LSDRDSFNVAGIIVLEALSFFLYTTAAKFLKKYFSVFLSTIKEMSFDKAKHTRNAERFLSQGKIRAAIGEYRRIVENDPKDFGTLNMLGDLCVKERDTQEAVKCYTQVAEHYAKQGFAQKAIAIYNKIARLNPGSPQVSAKLAQLYQMKGSVAEARAHYAELAEHYQKKGQKAEALAVWKQIAELDPNNTDIYLKIAEMCREQDLRDDAAEAFTEAGARFAAKTQFEQAAAAFAKALDIKSGNLVALNGLVNAQIGLGDADEAAKTLEEMLEKQPYNRDILLLLVNCYLDLNRTNEAERAAVKLCEQEPANYGIFLDVVKSYLKINDLQSSARVLSIVSEHLLVGGQSDELARWINEILAKNPEQLDALRLLIRLHGWQRDESELKLALERMAEAARAAEAFEDERSALSQLVVMVPQNPSYAQRLQEINEQFGYSEAVFGEPLAVHAPVIETFDAPSFESYAAPEGEVVGVARAEMYMEAYAEFNPSAYYNTAAGGDGGDHFSAGTDTAAGGLSDGFDYESYYQNESANGFAADFGGEISGGGGGKSASPAFIVGDFSANETDFATVSFESDAVEEISADEARLTAEESESNTEIKPETNDFDLSQLREELETAEYYFAQGYKDLAQKTLDSLAERYGELPEIAAARSHLNQETTATVVTASESEQFQPSDFDGDFCQAAAAAAQTSENATVGAWTSGSFDLVNEFRDELGLEESALSARAEDDYETRYQTGVAYQEMGLMEEAIREYQEAVKLTAPDDGTRRFFYCCNLLGHCFMEKGMPNIALMWYRRGLETDGLSDEELQGLRYEIASAYEAGGAPDKALEFFEQIYAVDVEYRDVGKRLSHLHHARA